MFNYIDDGPVQSKMELIHDALKASFNTFDTIFNTYEQPHIPNQQPTQFEEIYVVFINYFTRRMTSHYRNYGQTRLNQLSAGWNNVLAQNPTPQQAAIAQSCLNDIKALYDEVTALVFDNSNFSK